MADTIKSLKYDTWRVWLDAECVWNPSFVLFKQPQL
jgi:hypothetical protein